jgi:hypothetical protein
MKRRFHYIGGMLFMLLGISGCSTFHSIPAPPANLTEAPLTEQEIADASNRDIWGLYVDLPGTSRVSPRQKHTEIKWRWVRKGQAIEEACHIQQSKEPLNTYLIWRGDEPGTLYSQTPGLLGMAWRGWVQKDGSILFQGASPMAVSYQMAMADDGALEIRGASINDGALVSLSEVQPTDRYVATTATPGDKPSLASAGRPTNTAALQPVQRPPATPTSESAKPAQQAQEKSTASRNERQPKADELLAKANDEDLLAHLNLATTRLALGRAKVASDNAQSLLKAKMVMAAISKNVAPKVASKNGDFWTFCIYGMHLPHGQAAQYIVTNLINQRIYEYPYPTNSKQAKAELDAYQGPNMPYAVKNRFDNAVTRSGFIPRTLDEYALECFTYISLQSALSHYPKPGEDPSMTYVVWNSLEDEDLAGRLKVPTQAEIDKAKRDADEADRTLLAAQESMRQAEKRAALSTEAVKRAEACAAGNAKACGQ